jgi:hypothetical protein
MDENKLQKQGIAVSLRNVDHATFLKNFWVATL